MIKIYSQGITDGTKNNMLPMFRILIFLVRPYREHFGGILL